MSVTRSTLVVLLLAGCTKEAPPPQPPVEEPLAEEEPAPEIETVDKIDRSVRIEGALTEAQVEEVVKEHFFEIQGCFDDALVRMASSNLTGGIAIRMEIDGSGAVTGAELEETSFDDAETVQCITGHVTEWSFPSSGKGDKPSTVIYPFFLRSY